MRLFLVAWTHSQFGSDWLMRAAVGSQIMRGCSWTNCCTTWRDARRTLSRLTCRTFTVSSMSVWTVTGLCNNIERLSGHRSRIHQRLVRIRRDFRSIWRTTAMTIVIIMWTPFSGRCTVSRLVHIHLRSVLTAVTAWTKTKTVLAKIAQVVSLIPRRAHVLAHLANPKGSIKPCCQRIPSKQ